MPNVRIHRQTLVDVLNVPEGEPTVERRKV